MILTQLNRLKQAQIPVGTDLTTANVRFIVGNVGSFTASDTAIKAILDAQVGAVQVSDDASSAYNTITNHDFTVISSSIISSFVSSLISETKPIITCEFGNDNEFNIADGAASATFASVTIINSHPITTGISSPFDYNLAGASVAQNAMYDGVSATGVYVGNITTNRNAIIAFDTGDTLIDGTSTAADKRIYIAGEAAGQWSADTQTIFINALKWCYGASI
jgi:hypothetical protein